MAAAMRPQNVSFKNQTMLAVLDACRLILKRKNATQKAPSKKTTVISPANKKDGIKAVLSCIS